MLKVIETRGWKTPTFSGWTMTIQADTPEAAEREASKLGTVADIVTTGTQHTVLVIAEPDRGNEALHTHVSRLGEAIETKGSQLLSLAESALEALDDGNTALAYSLTTVALEMAAAVRGFGGDVQRASWKLEAAQLGA